MKQPNALARSALAAASSLVILGCSAARADSTPVKVVKVFCSGTEVHLLLSDGREAIPGKLRNQTGCSDPAIAADQKTVGWLAEYDEGGQSYPLPLTLVIYRSGKIIRQFSPNGLVIWDWHFWRDGQQVAYSWGASHGGISGYRLFDVESGRLLEEVNTPDQTAEKQKLPPWAQGLCGGDC